MWSGDKTNVWLRNILFLLIIFLIGSMITSHAQEPEKIKRSEDKLIIPRTPGRTDPVPFLKQKTDIPSIEEQESTRARQKTEARDNKEQKMPGREVTQPVPSKKQKESFEREKQKFTPPTSVSAPGVKQEALPNDQTLYGTPSRTKQEPLDEYSQPSEPDMETQPGTTSKPWYESPQILKGTSPGSQAMSADMAQELDFEPLPDLVIENFEINLAQMQHLGLTTRYPMQASVKNIGSTKVAEPFYVSFEYIMGEQGPWVINRTESRAIKIDQEIGPDQEISVTGFVILTTADISDTPVQIRAVVDSAEFQEFPPAHGNILESNEYNNTSNSVQIPGFYWPVVTGISKTEAIKGTDVVMLYGMGLGSAKPGRTVVLVKDDNMIAAEVSQWSDGGVLFKVPEDTPTGHYQVYIGETGLSSLLLRSDESESLLVLNRRELPWGKLVDGFNYVFTGYFSIRLHTWSGGSMYQNTSEMMVYGHKDPVPIMVPLIQFKTSMGYYRFLVNDMNTLGFYDEDLGFSLNRDLCADNQLRLVILFEDQGKEMIGYYKVLGPAGKWRRTGAPDVHVNDARIEILFQFVDAGQGNLDYQAAVIFSGDVHASGSGWDNILDLFMSGWNSDVKENVRSSVRQAVNMQETRQNICQSLIQSIRFLAGLKQENIIFAYDFTSEGILVTYH